MLRSRILLGSILVVALAAATYGLAWAQSPDAQQLQQKVEALETRLATLERTLAQRLGAIEQRLAQGGTAGNAAEPQAEAAYSQIAQLVAQGEYEKAQGEMAEFMKAYGSTNTAKKARRMYEELSVIGKAVPSDWGVEKWYQGEKDVSLDGKKTTLLVFWEEWCPHCKREVPKLDQFYSDLKASGLQVVGFTKVTRSSTEDKVTDFIQTSKLSYPQAKENGNLSQYFNVSGVPAAAVVKDGKVVWRGHPAQLNETQLKGWL